MKNHKILLMLFISLVVLVSGKVFGMDDAWKASKPSMQESHKKEGPVIGGHRQPSPTNIPTAIKDLPASTQPKSNRYCIKPS